MLPMAAMVTVAALVAMVQLENCQLVLIIIFASSVYLGNVQAPTQLLVRLVCKLALPAFHGAVAELAGCRLGFSYSPSPRFQGPEGPKFLQSPKTPYSTCPMPSTPLGPPNLLGKTAAVRKGSEEKTQRFLNPKP